MPLSSTLWGVDFTVWSVNFSVWGVDFTVWGVDFSVWSVNFTVWNVNFTVWNVNFTVWGGELYGVEGQHFRRGRSLNRTYFGNSCIKVENLNFKTSKRLENIIKVEKGC